MKMKKKYLIMLSLFFVVATSVNAQIAIGNQDGPHKAAVLDLKSSSNKGLLLPKGELNMNDLTEFVLDGEAEKATAEGMVIYNTSDQGIYYWDGEKWNALMSKEEIKEVSITHYTIDGEISNETNLDRIKRNELIEVAVHVQGEGVISYQWYSKGGYEEEFDGPEISEPVPGATGHSITISGYLNNAGDIKVGWTFNDNSYFYCVITQRVGGIEKVIQSEVFRATGEDSPPF